MLQVALNQFQKLFPILTPDGPPNGRKFKRVALIVATLMAMAVYFLPFLLLGSRSYITVHDNLDGEFVVNYLLVATGKAFAHGHGATLDNIMNGLPRAAMPSALNVGVLLFYIFSPAWAYIVDFILIHTIAFCGIFLLLRKYIFPEDQDLLLAGAISICFFLVPYYTIYGISVAGQPLLAYAFLNIRNGRRSWKDYLTILIFPLWSDIALIAPFAVTALGIILLVDWIRTHRLNKALLGALVLFVATYSALQYQLIDSILGSHTWVSHRTAWNRWTDFSVASNLHKTLDMLLHNQEHIGAFSTLPILVAIAFGLLLLAMRKRRAGMLDIVAVAIAAVCIEYGFYDWIVRVSGRLIPASFNASRYYFLLPFLWMLAFALCLKEFSRWRKWLPLVWCLVVIQALVLIRSNGEYRNTVALVRGRPIYEPSFDRFFARDLFSEIDTFIGKPKNSYRVVSIGLEPSIAQFNGFYTLDGYLTNYSLAYKYEFRKIIAPELAKNAQIRAYFDVWGSRCYVFSSEVGISNLVSADRHYVLHNLDLNTDQLRAMGGEYLISAAYIEDSGRSGLALEREFFTPSSFWHLYLYKVQGHDDAFTAHYPMLKRAGAVILDPMMHSILSR